MKSTILLSIFLCATVVSFGATNYYVKIDGSDDANGTSLENAFATIGKGLNTAASGDTIIVSDGTYYEEVSFEGKSVWLKSTDPNSPTVVGQTLIVGSGNDVITFASSEDANAVIDGFTITGGGKGIYCERSSPTIRNCIISGNSDSGLAVMDQALPLISKCQFSSNSAKYGGGIYSFYSSPIITDCNFIENTASSRGGAIYNSFTSPQITNCVFSRNTATTCGGGVFNSTSNPIISKCQFLANSSKSGSGIYNDVTSEPNIINTVIARGDSSAIEGGSGFVNNCTIAFNNAKGIADSSAAIKNCILWSNDDDLSNALSTYSCVQDGDSGAGNINSFPYFVDADSNDYHLLSYSPCIDMGDPCSAYSNEPSGGGGRIDMGAYGNTSGATIASADSDSDGLPDDWAVKYGISTPLTDKDNDTVKNIREYISGTDPNNSASKDFNSVTIRVPSRVSTIQHAVDVACDTDVVLVSTGTYQESINLGTKTLTLSSTDPNVSNTVIDATNNHSYVVQAQSGGLIRGFTLKNATSDGFRYSPANQSCGAPVVENCVMTDNSTGIFSNYQYGGAVKMVVTKCNMVRNSSHGIYLAFAYNSGASISISDCNISSNKVRGIWVSSNVANKIEICRSNIIKNGSDGYSEGRDHYLSFTNCVIAKNGFVYQGGSYGNAIVLYSGNNATITNCTIYGNHGGVSNCQSTPIFNSICWNSSGNLSGAQNAKYCCTNTLLTGIGNINSNPQVVDANDPNDFRLRSSSPCIDAGAPWSDFSTERTPNGGRIDMGAFGNTDQSTTSVDGDNDGISDNWEIAKWPGQDPNLHTPTGDEENSGAGDGFTNYIEYLFGYNPTQVDTISYIVGYVGISRTSFDPTKGEYIDISYWLNRNASVETKFREKVSQQISHSFTFNGVAGLNTVRWYGKDAENLIIDNATYQLVVKADAGAITDEKQYYEFNLTYPHSITNIKCDPSRIIPANNEITSLSYDISCDASMCIEVYDPCGVKFATILSGTSQASAQNPQEVIWSGRTDASGKYIAKEGIYTIKVRFDGMREQQSTTVTAYK